MGRSKRAAESRDEWSINGHKLKKLNANDLVYTKTNTVTEVFRCLTEYSLITTDEIKESCLFAIRYSKGQCIYCGKQLIVFDNDNVMHEIIDDDGELKPHSDDCKCGFHAFFGLHHYQMDHLYAAADLCVPYKGAMVLACDKCNNAKGDKAPNTFIKELHEKREAGITLHLPEDQIQSVYIDDINEHMNVLKPLISMYYRESKRHGTLKLLTNATGFNMERMIDDNGCIDFDRVLGRNNSFTYPSYVLNMESEDPDKKNCYELRDVPRMSVKEAMQYLITETLSNMKFDSKPRMMAKDLCDMSDPFIQKYFIYDNLGQSEEKNNGTRLQKSEVQNVVRKYFNGGDFTNITDSAEIYRRLDPYLTMKLKENDEKLSTIKTSSIYSIAKLSMKLILKAFDRETEIPNAVIFKQLKNNGIPYEMWSTILTINDKCLKAEGSSSYIEGICYLIKKHGWDSDALLNSFLNGDLIREEIPYHVRNVPQEDRIKYIDGALGKDGRPVRSNFFCNIESRNAKWSSAVVRYHKKIAKDYSDGDKYDTPTPIEIRRMFNLEPSLRYNDLEVVYNNIRLKFSKKNNKGNITNDYYSYSTLEKHWLSLNDGTKNILDFNHGLTGLNESIKQYVTDTSDRLQGKKRDKKRNEFSKCRKSILNIMIPAIRSRITSEGSDSEWINRGWTSDPVYDVDLEDWASNSTFVQSSAVSAEKVEATVKNITDSIWIKDQVAGREWNWMKGLEEFIGMIDQIAHEVAGRSNLDEYMPNEHDLKMIYWTMMSKSDDIEKDYDRSEWFKKIKWFFNTSNLPIIRRADPGKEPIYSFILRMSKHKHVDFVELCELISSGVGADKMSIQSMAEYVNLDSIECTLDNLKGDFIIENSGIRAIRTPAILNTYQNTTGGIPVEQINGMSSSDRQRLYAKMSKVMKTYKWYLTEIHHDVPSIIINRIQDTASGIIDFVKECQ